MPLTIRRISMNALKSKVEYLVVFFFIILSDSVSLPISADAKVSLTIVLGIVVYYIYLSRNHFIVKKEESIFVVLISVFCLLSQIVNMDSSFSYEYKIAELMLGFVFACSISFDRFKEIFINLMCVIAIVSIVVYITVQVGSTWWTELPMTNNNQTYSFFLTTIPVNLAHRARLFGPYWEPGVFQVYLNLAILFIVLEKLNIKKIIILVLAVILTFSTTGYLCLIIIFIIYLTLNSTKINVIHLYFALFVGIGLVVLLQNEYIQMTVFDKFYSDSTANASFILRMENLRLYFIEWLQNPILGKGITESSGAVNSYFKSESIYTYYSGTTSTTMRELAGMGVIVGGLRLVMVGKFCRRLSRNKYTFILLFILFMIFLNTEDFIYSLFFNMLFYYGLYCTYKSQYIEKTKNIDR